ncbi:lanthionine synthetase C-like, partial [Kipferlia bialata]|eukprot:g16152.t1
MAVIQATINTLLTQYQLSSGNMPSSLGRSQTKDTIVQWCHGAPGYIPLMCACVRVYPDQAERYISHAIKMAETVWERGLLRKGVGLCHGIAGNGYAFL